MEALEADLESQLLVEILHTTSILHTIKISLLEQLLDGLAGLHALVLLLEVLLLDRSLQINVADGVAGGHHVVEVDHLDEGLHLAALQDRLLAHAASHAQGGAVKASDQCVGEVVFLVSLIEGLDDNRLLASITACQHDHNLAGLDEFSHVDEVEE